MTCPWGGIQSVMNVCIGVSFISTASHGGVRVAKGWAAKNLTQAARNHATDWDKDYLWYEEDCDWALVLFENPDINPSNYDAAVKTVSYWHWKYLSERKLYPNIDIDHLKKNDSGSGALGED